MIHLLNHSKLGWRSLHRQRWKPGRWKLHLPMGGARARGPGCHGRLTCRGGGSFSGGAAGWILEFMAIKQYGNIENIWNHVVPSLSHISHGFLDVFGAMVWLSFIFWEKTQQKALRTYTTVEHLAASGIFGARIPDCTCLHGHAPRSRKKMLVPVDFARHRSSSQAVSPCRLRWCLAGVDQERVFHVKSACILPYSVLDKSTLVGHSPWKSSWLSTHTYMHRERERYI